MGSCSITDNWEIKQNLELPIKIIFSQVQTLSREGKTTNLTQLTILL